MIIDPSGQATEFIMNEYKDRKITRTSFLDDAFRKNLESALRFGNPLLVQVSGTIVKQLFKFLNSVLCIRKVFNCSLSNMQATLFSMYNLTSKPVIHVVLVLRRISELQNQKKVFPFPPFQDQILLFWNYFSLLRHYKTTCNLSVCSFVFMCSL